MREKVTNAPYFIYLKLNQARCYRSLYCTYFHLVHTLLKPEHFQKLMFYPSAVGPAQMEGVSIDMSVNLLVGWMPSHKQLLIVCVDNFSWLDMFVVGECKWIWPILLKACIHSLMTWCILMLYIFCETQCGFILHTIAVCFFAALAVSKHSRPDWHVWRVSVQYHVWWVFFLMQWKTLLSYCSFSVSTCHY